MPDGRVCRMTRAWFFIRLLIVFRRMQKAIEIFDYAGIFYRNATTRVVSS